MSKNKPLREKENLEAEIKRLEAELKRSLSVARMKEAHKQIEEIEKSRKRTAILSIVERLNLNIQVYQGIMAALTSQEKKISEHLLQKKLPDDFSSSLQLNHIVKTYESIYFDLRRNIDVKQEDFDKLFPKVIKDFSTVRNIMVTINCIFAQMIDMRAYCLRLLM